jgi:amidohydrolase
MDMLEREIEAIALEIKDKLISIRRDIHRYPELGFREHRTSSVITNALKNLKLQVDTHIAATGVTGLLKTGRAGRTTALRADMDALSIAEENDFDYASRNNGIMHACGHDVHVAVVLGAAEILCRLKDRLQGNVRFVFQPGEEGLGGARYMVEEGVLKNPPVDAIIAAHVHPGLDTGRISILQGPVMASPAEFEIVILGKGGHAAMPHNTVDPICIGTNLVNLFQTLITREKDPMEKAVISVTSFHSWVSFNIIPDTAVLKGTVRTFDPALDKFIARRMEEITEAVTKVSGAACRFAYRPGYPAVVNDSSIVQQVKTAATRQLGSDGTVLEAAPAMLGEDFSYYQQVTPGAMFNLGCRKPGSPDTQNLHSSTFTPDEDCIEVGMRIMAQWAVNALCADRDRDRD